MCRVEQGNATPIKCMNCEAEVLDNYCPNCGQPAKTAKLKIRSLIKGVFEGLMDFDKPLYRTLIGLTIKPGKIISEYVDGKRKSYSNPVKYGLSTSALLLILIKFRGSMAEVISETIPQNPLLSEKMVEFLHYYGEFNRAVVPYTHIITLFSMPVLASLLYLFFRKSGRSVADHMAFGCFIFGHLVLFNSLLIALNLHKTNYDLIVFLQNSVPVLYLTWGAIVFNKNRFFPGLLRAVSAYFLFILFFLILSFLITILMMNSA